jgi:uncharacterized protein YggE
MRTTQAGLGLLGALALLAGGWAGAQEPAGGTLTGQGSGEIKRQPEVLRVQVEVLAKGKDFPEALGRLKDRREAALKQLALLGASKGSIDVSEPAVTSEKTDQQRQLERMVAQQIRAQGNKAKAAAKQAPPVVVGVTIKADLPLKAAGAEELLAVAHGLQEKVKAADLGGLKELAKLSPQEEEAAEEAQAAAQMPGAEEMPKRGEPVFLFVSKVPEAERAKALAEAFGNAKREAARLARAAGAELGPLYRLESQSQQNRNDDGNAAMNPYMYWYAQQARAGMPANAEAQPDEVTGLVAGRVTLRVLVTAVFQLKPGAGKP